MYYCKNCDEFVDAEFKDVSQTYEYWGAKVKEELAESRCTYCGNEVKEVYICKCGGPIKSGDWCEDCKDVVSHFNGLAQHELKLNDDDFADLIRDWLGW